MDSLLQLLHVHHMGAKNHMAPMWCKPMSFPDCSFMTLVADQLRPRLRTQHTSLVSFEQWSFLPCFTGSAAWNRNLVLWAQTYGWGPPCLVGSILRNGGIARRLDAYRNISQQYWADSRHLNSYCYS
jgi:hypothetical protein